jgi:hypothetical protein
LKELIPKQAVGQAHAVENEGKWSLADWQVLGSTDVKVAVFQLQKFNRIQPASGNCRPLTCKVWLVNKLGRNGPQP